MTTAGARSPAHEPDAYFCPFCRMLAGDVDGAPQRSDIVAETELSVAFISPRWWAGNEGHVLVIPRAHEENLYEVSDEDLAAVMALAKRVAVAMRQTYDCTGTSLRQHNEPDGGQDVWHFHVHVFPRRHDDRLYERAPLDGFVAPAERAAFARRLRPAVAG